MSQVYPSAQNDIPVTASYGPVTYAAGYGSPEPGLFSAGPILAPSSGYLVGPSYPIPVYPTKGSAGMPIDLTHAGSASVGQPEHHAPTGQTPSPSSFLLFGGCFAMTMFVAWIKSRTE